MTLYTYALNIARSTGKMNWNGTEPEYRHFASIELGDIEEVAKAKALIFKQGLEAVACNEPVPRTYLFTFRATVVPTTTSVVL